MAAVGWKSLVPPPLRRLARALVDGLPFEFRWREATPEWPGETNRFGYLERYVTFEVRPGDRVLDIGSGGDPFPRATFLAERYLEPSRHRHVELKRDARPLVVADVQALPFRARSFDYVYCAHVLEHVDDPLRACAEILRVGRRGFIETPARCKDILFAWAEGMHRWHLVGIGGRLCFFEYGPREQEGIRSGAWRDLVFSPWRNPIQEAFRGNQDLFNVLFPWDGTFAAYVFRQDGSVESLVP